MMHKSLKLALVGLLVASSASALSEWRTPWITERGPIRYTFEKLNPEKYNANFWWAGHYKAAEKAFLKHSTKNVPLTALIFNKADFTMYEAFPNLKVPMGTEEYSPYLRLTKFSPRVNYSEFGFTFGGRWDYPVWDHKGRIGLRASVPFRQVKMERQDFRDNDDNPWEEYVSSDLIKITRNSPASDVGAGANQAAAVVGLATPVHDAVGMVGGNLAAGDIAQKAAVNVAAAALVNYNLANVDTNMRTNGIISSISGGNPNATWAGGIETVAGVNATPDATASQVAIGAVSVANVTIGADVKTAVATTYATQINAAADRGDRAKNPANVFCTAFNAAFVAGLEDTDHKSSIQVPSAHVVQICGPDVQVAAVQKNRANVGLSQASSQVDLVADGYVTWMPANQTGLYSGSDEVAVSDIVPLTNLTTDITGQVGYFDSAVDYSGLIDPTTQDFASEAAANAAAQRWITFRRANDGAPLTKFAHGPLGSSGDDGKTISDAIMERLQQYREGPYTFMARHGYDMDTHTRRGLGDIDLDLFYEHTFNKEWMGELWTGVRFPTGSTKNQYSSPYTPMLGNGGHFEVKLGGQLCYQPWTWMNAKLDLYYSFVIESTIHTMAAFRGARIKNMGPRADADVDWGYFVGRLDFNFFHPKTSDIRSTVGYEFYYKTEDHLTYKHSTMTPWYGDFKDGTTAAAALSNKLARANTEGISHKVRFEASYQVMKYLEIFSAVSAVFAGQNVMQDRDCNIGFNVRF